MAIHLFNGNNGDNVPVTLIPSDFVTFAISNNKVITTDFAGGLFEYSGISDCIITARITMNAGGGASSGVRARYTSNKDFITAFINRSGTFRLFNYTLAGGGAQVGSTFNIPSFNTSTEYEIKMRLEGTNVICYLDGVERINAEVTDNVNGTTHLINFADIGPAYSYFSVTDLDGAPVVPEFGNFSRINIQTTDSLPANEMRKVTIFDQSSMDKIDETTLQFSNGSAQFDSFFTRGGTPVVLYAPDSNDNSASVAYANHRNSDVWEDGPNKLYAVPVYGQSLAVGTTATTVYFPDTVNGGLMFGGVPPEGNSYVDVPDGDMKEIRQFQNQQFETHGYGFIKKLRELNAASDDFTPVFWANSGLTGANISSLASTGNIPLRNLYRYITGMSYRAATLGVDVEYPFWLFDQGESDRSTPEATWKATLRGLHDGITSAANAITGQSTFPVILSSIGSIKYNATNYNHGPINAAIYNYYLENDDAYISQCKYYLSYHYASTDFLHLNGKGYTIQGEYHAITAARILASKEAGDNPPVAKILEPLSYSSAGNVITVAMHVPVPPMVIDTTLLPELLGYGVLYVKPDTTEIIPTVSISGDSILIDIGEPPVEGAVIKWGAADPAVWNQMLNIRDSQAIPSLVEGEFLYNWFPCHYHTLTAGEV